MPQGYGGNVSLGCDKNSDAGTCRPRVRRSGGVGRGSEFAWGLRALGDVQPAVLRGEYGGRLSEEIEQALEIVWMTHRDWLRTEEAMERAESSSTARSLGSSRLRWSVP